MQQYIYTYIYTICSSNISNIIYQERRFDDSQIASRVTEKFSMPIVDLCVLTY